MNKFDMNNLTGLASGFEKLDAVTNGWQNGDLIVIAGRPAMGKTAFALSLVRNMAIEKKIPVAMFSLEMTKVQLVNRLISNVSEVSSEKIRSRKLAKKEWSQIETGISSMLGAPLYVDDTPSLSVADLRMKARKLVRDYGVKMIIIDYLQLLNVPNVSNESHQEEVATISRSLKLLARELDIPVLVLSQLNRSVEQRSNRNDDAPTSKRPQLGDLSESGAIEQYANLVCFIHRPEYYKIMKDQYGNDTKGRADFIIAKHHCGDLCDICLYFHKKNGAFMNEENKTSEKWSTKEAILSKLFEKEGKE